jgi:hypothetical protein
MAEKLNWSYAAQVESGPSIAGAGVLEVDAYVKLSVTVAAGETQAVEVLPDPGAALQFLVIAPAVPSADLTYELDGDAVPLDGPVVLIGAGAVALFADAVGTLEFTNDTGADARIDILAGRDATP